MRWRRVASATGRTASRAVGYAQALAVLDGTMTRDEAVADTAARTRRLVRRQQSWFGADPRVRWLDALDPDLPDRATALVEAAATEPRRRGGTMVGMADGLAFTKGHGTENDFVLVPDLDGSLGLSAARAAALADRRAGVGGDGVIRVVATECSDDPDVRAQAGDARWFMDYRNADGGLSEMCGNGTRVFAAFLRREGLETADEFLIATRAGAKRVRAEGAGWAVDLGPWRLGDPVTAAEDGFDALVHVGDGDPYSALSVELGNPHTVVALPEAVDLDGLDLTRAPLVRPEPPNGTNVELVRPIGPGHLAMRVHERGVGETRSCGSGACAAAIATSYWAGTADEQPVWVVDVRGGRLTVRLLPEHGVELAGPAVLVADGTVDLGLLPA